MVQTSLLLGALPLLAGSAYARYQTEAKISLFEASTTKQASSLTNLDCDASQPSTSVELQIDECLWGDYNLVNNFKITQYPKCANGHDAGAVFYATTSCTGNPTFRSDKYRGGLDTCLFGSSSEQWSMVFRCGNTKTQAIQRRRFIQAVPPPSKRKTFKPKPKPMDGVVTPYGSYDCSIYRPKEPTFLPADACLPLEKNHSLLIHEPAICGDGRVALVNTYDDEECTESTGWLGTDAFSDEYYSSINKKCHTSNAGSMMFKCGKQEDVVMFKDLPEQKFKKVEQLRLLEDLGEVSATPKLSPPIVATPEKEVPIIDGHGSTSEIEKSYKKEGTTGRISAQRGTFRPYYLENCKNDRAVAPVSKPVDTCVWTFMWKSIKVTSPALCPNGTQALFATYSRPGCKAAELTSIGKIPEAFTSGCGDINDIDSIAFICEGLPASEIGNKGSVGGLIKTLLIILLIVVLMIGLSILSCCLRGAAMMQQANLLWERVSSLFGKKEGEIQL